MHNTSVLKIEGFNRSDIPCGPLNRTTAKIGETIVCGLIFITSLLGNMLVVIVVYRERRMRTMVNFLIVNMAVSDFLCTLSVVPRVITQTFTYPDAWMITGAAGDAMCKIVLFLQDVTVAVSLLSLLMIAIERYQAITSPLVADPSSGRRCKIMILSTWLVACLIYATHFYTFKLIIEDEGAICVHTWEPFLAEPSKVWEIEFLLHSILFVFIPFIVVFSLYTAILVRVRRTSVPGDTSSRTWRGRRNRQKRNRNVLRMLLTVVIAFGVCWFPFIIYTYVVTFVYSDLELSCGMIIIRECALYLAYLNSSINPAIYFTFCENYRKGLRNIIRPCLHPLVNGLPTCRSKTIYEKREAGLQFGKGKERQDPQDIELRLL